MPDPLVTSGGSESPRGIADTLDTSDPGDETQRNFRYQHAYGVILLVAGARGREPYVALWCEHHEDLLCERSDGRFDGYQIKTRRPEIGDWTTNDEPFRRSIKRFVALLRRFPDDIDKLHFVSNAECSDSADGRHIAKSPQQLRRALEGCRSIDEVPAPFADTLTDLASFCDCTTSEVFNCLRRVHFVKGPSRDSFDTELAHDHLSTLPAFQFMIPAQLNRVRDSLVQLVYKASSLQVDSPDRHLCPVDATDRRNPRLMSKRLDVKLALETVDSAAPFRYLPVESALPLGDAFSQAPRRSRKLSEGGLGAYTELMERRALSAEAHLIEFAHLQPELAKAAVNQIENIVLGECMEARLAASAEGSPYGTRMLVDVNERLRHAARNEPSTVYCQPYEVLSGVAALLTGACKVWWSPEFDVEATP